MCVLHRNGNPYLNLVGMDKAEAEAYAAKMQKQFPAARWSIKEV